MELIHTCYRITDIARSVAFYEALGFEERARMPIREEAINVFMGLPGEHFRLEARELFVEDGRAVPVAGLGEVAVRVLGRAVERDEGVEDEVRHVDSFRR